MSIYSYDHETEAYLSEQARSIINNRISQMKFKVGDIVKLVSDRYSDSAANPRWEGSYGKIKGKIVRVLSRSSPYSIDWETANLIHLIVTRT